MRIAGARRKAGPNALSHSGARVVSLVATISLVCVMGCGGMAWRKAESVGTVAAYEEYIRQHPDTRHAHEARLRVQAMRFSEAKATGTIDAYEDFLRRYPDSGFVREAHQRLEILCFERAESDGTLTSCEDFLRRYPQSTYANDIRQRLETLHFDRAVERGTISSFEDFLRRYPQSSHADQARQEIEDLHFSEAEKTGSIAAYEGFLRRYPQSEHAAEARRKIEALRFDKVKATGTIAAYEDYVRENPGGDFAAEAATRVEALKTEIRHIEEATRRVLPEGAEVEVTTVSRYPKAPEFVIAAHLLEGHSADEESPYVRGDYGTHEKLTRLVQLRCARIIQSVAVHAMPAGEAELVVCGRHGVRQSYLPGGFGGTDVAMTIYEVGIPVNVLRSTDAAAMDIESLKSLWRVRENIIPSLQFQQVFR